MGKYMGVLHRVATRWSRRNKILNPRSATRQLCDLRKPFNLLVNHIHLSGILKKMLCKACPRAWTHPDTW